MTAFGRNPFLEGMPAINAVAQSLPSRTRIKMLNTYMKKWWQKQTRKMDDKNIQKNMIDDDENMSDKTMIVDDFYTTLSFLKKFTAWRKGQTEKH